MGFFRKCNQIFRKLRIWSQLLKKSLIAKLYFLCSPSSISDGPCKIWFTYWYVILRRGSSKWLFGWRWQYLSCYSSKKFRCNFLGLFLYFASCIPVESNFIFLWVSNDEPYFPRVCLGHNFLLLSWTKMTFRDYPLSEEIRS